MKPIRVLLAMAVITEGCCGEFPEQRLDEARRQLSELRPGVTAQEAKRILQSNGFKVEQQDPVHIEGERNVDFCLQMLARRYVEVFVDLDDSGHVASVDVHPGIVAP